MDPEVIKFFADSNLLTTAVINNNFEAVKFFVSLGINVNEQDGLPLICAAQNRRIEVIKFLVEKGANIHAKNDTVLKVSAQNGDFELVKYFIEKGANIHADDGYALRVSIEKGHLELAKYLIEKGANIQHVDFVFTLSFYGHQHRILELVKYLVSIGANIHVENNYPLRWASANGNLELVKYFIEKGANIHSDNECALRWSANYGHIEVVKYLIEKGANINIAIKECKNDNTKNLLRKYIIKKEFYKGHINDQTETECGICLTEINSIKQEITQCNVCKKCVHNECNLKWMGNCIYCRNY